VYSIKIRSIDSKSWPRPCKTSNNLSTACTRHTNSASGSRGQSLGLAFWVVSSGSWVLVSGKSQYPSGLPLDSGPPLAEDATIVSQPSWKALEENARRVASLIWGQPCVPEEIAGVKVDGVIKVKPNYWVLLEITERKDLAKLREDLAKFNTVVPMLLSERIFAECYFITENEPPESIPKSAQAQHVVACSLATFASKFFDFESYHTARQDKPFGSSFNPFTREPDRLRYIPVSYVDDNDSQEFDIAAISDRLLANEKIVLTGDYGTGKSRCVREVYGELARSYKIGQTIPIAIDLRNTWGLTTAEEILSRHLNDLGLAKLQQHAISAIDKGTFILLLDGFDELGTQAWSEDPRALVTLRRRALEGVRDLVRRSRSGLLITGRKNYFNSRLEMLEALGAPKDCITLQCQGEFSPEQFQRFIEEVLPGTEIPYWLPRRPLICQVIAEMEDEHRHTVSGEFGDQTGFWDHFIRMVTTRESWIRHEMTPEAVQLVLRGLARHTRRLPGDFGPLQPSDIFSQFRKVLDAEPTAESAQILYRLPGLGLTDSDSSTRQFIDRFLLDGLRGDDTCQIISQREHNACREVWLNPLGHLGQLLVARLARAHGRGEILTMASRASRNGNCTMSLDLTGALLSTLNPNENFDFEGLTISGGRITFCDLGMGHLSNLHIRDAYIELLMIDRSMETDVTIDECAISIVVGVTHEQGLPSWINDCLVDYYQSVQTTSRIKESHLSTQHQILCTVLQKTFFQKGAGRKEQALLRGLGQLDRGGYRNKILRILIREKILYVQKGDDGSVYHPVRSETGRIQKMMAELDRSKDVIWTMVGGL